MSIRLLLGCTFLFFPAHPPVAQTGPVEDGPPRFTISARAVVEDVVVTNKDGRAVPNLRKEDFEVFENGKPQAITFFEPNFAPTEAVTNPSSQLPTGTFTNISTAPPNNVTNVLLLDALNTPSAERMYAQVRMVKYLASLPPNMRIAVFTLDDEKFHVIWGANQDSSELRAAIARITAKHSAPAPSLAVAQQRAEQQELAGSVSAVKQRAMQAGDDRLGESADALRHFLNHGSGIIDQYSNFFTTMSALESLAHYLAGIPGRKNLFWIAGTFPHQFKSDAYFAWYRRAWEMLADAEVSVYPIDANGVDVDTGGVQDPTSMPKSVLRFADTEAWAEDTGGKAYHENDIPQEIANAASHGSHYYSLAYVPSDEGGDRERKVEVKVLSGNYKLFYQRSYFEKPPREIAELDATPANDRFLGLMGHGMPNISEISYELKVMPVAERSDTEPSRGGQNAQLRGKLTRYSLGFRLLPNFLLLLPDTNGARRQRLEVILMVYSQDGRSLNWESHAISLLIKPGQWDKARTEGVSFNFEIDAPSGDVYLRTGVYDASLSRVGTLEIPLSAVMTAQK